jgi:hypothetical protein
MLEVRPGASGKFQLLLNQVAKDHGLWRDRTALTERLNFLMSIGVRFEPIAGSILRWGKDHRGVRFQTLDSSSYLIPCSIFLLRWRMRLTCSRHNLQLTCL